MTRFLLFLTMCISSIVYAQKTDFTKETLSGSFLDIKKNKVSFAEILKKHQGKTVVLEIWASWCSDCVAAMPKLKELQEKFTNVDYVFISMDKTYEAWIKGIEKHKIIGNHYFSNTPWKKSEFAKSITLDWIPRYMVISPKGKIILFKAVEPDDKKLIHILSNIKDKKTSNKLMLKPN